MHVLIVERPPLSKLPKLAREWHPVRNGELRPSDVTAGSAKRVWWRCSKGHEWQQGVRGRAHSLGRCPYCAGRRGTSEDNLAVSHPAIARMWDQAKNGTLRPEDVRSTSNKYVWWKCLKSSDHEWQELVRHHAERGARCPFCTGRRLSRTNTLAKVAPSIAAQWHPTKNGDTTPKMQLATASQQRWWKCPKGPDHEWCNDVNARVVRGEGCPFCAGRRASITNSLAQVAPDVAALWHPTKNDTLTPHQVTCGSDKRVWWRCLRGPDHEWQAAISNRVNGGTRCPFCVNKCVSVTNSLMACYPKVAADWHPTKNGELTPQDVTWGSGKTAWWRCTRGHVWRTRIGHRTGSGSGCPTCEFMTRRGRPPAMRRRVASVVRL